MDKVQIADVSTPVLVLGSNHYGSLSVTRSLGRLGVNVHVHESNVRSPVFYSKYCHGKFVWKDAETSPRLTVDYLLEIAEKIGTRSILVPYSDENANTISKYSDALKKYYLFPNNSPEVVTSISNKREMHFLAKKYDVNTPEACFPESKSDVERYLRNVKFPLMLKTISSHSRFGGGTNFIVKTREQLFNLYDRYENPSIPNLFLQEFIPGGDESSWMFNGYFNDQSECLFGLTGRKIRQSRPVGVTCFGICQKNKDVLEMSKRFITGLGYKGMVDVDYRYDRRDGKHKVIDVNPRIGLTFRLFAASNDLDVMRAAYLDLTKQPVPEGQIIDGRKYLVESSYLLSNPTECSSILSHRDRANSLNGLQETAYFALDDPDPFFIMFLQTAGKILKR